MTNEKGPIDAQVLDMAEQGSMEKVVLETDEVRYKQLLRKIDWHLMPLMCIIYGIQFLDKTTLSYASVMGIKKDTHLQGNEYALLGTMFYVRTSDHATVHMADFARLVTLFGNIPRII